MTTTTNYQQQAIDFLESTSATFSATYLKTGKYFTGDKDERDIYEIAIVRGNRSYKFNFGQSVNNSGKYKISIYIKNMLNVNRRFASELEIKKLRLFGNVKQDITVNENFSAPTAYGVLASLTKYDPGTFENFCGDFGYNTDSRIAEKTYDAVKDEYLNVSRLFNDAELEVMQEIQ